MKRQIITRNRAKCKKCGNEIESKYRHDFKWCSCEEIFVDGGLDYLRRGAKEFKNFEELSEYTEVEIHYERREPNL